MNHHISAALVQEHVQDAARRADKARLRTLVRNDPRRLAPESRDQL